MHSILPWLNVVNCVSTAHITNNSKKLKLLDDGVKKQQNA